ncbi:hypothetical protein B0F90DRAFT_1877150 [Multifurca ochricompacta]|uniref:Protein kinase domain-containing protein n=1 Tax=Multifurca ochricompacta TaxID=376703 RepID=A0AAD4QKA9_9AGAM|nr:hypothetical protein B0F90DRAFT_1877150 [Multifurca ochricompacta]
MVYPYICSFWGSNYVRVSPRLLGKNKAESDALVEQDLDDKTFGEKVATVGHLELKNELGVAGQWLRKLLTNDKYKDICNTTCCPCIIISIAGPYIMFGGAICAGIFVAEAFTDFIYLGGAKEQMHLQEIPTILSQFDYEGREPDNYQCSLFVATYNDCPVLIKFCQAYHGNAHHIVADAGYAPQLFFCERLQGGVIIIIMELVDGRDAFHHFGSTKTIPSDLLDDVKAAISKLHAANLVFGDMRRPNILVKKEIDRSQEIDRLRALLIGFEWVGEAGQARYPPLLNDSGEIAWAEGYVRMG